MTNNNDLWEVDRGDYVNIVTELRAELAAMTAERDKARAELDEARLFVKSWEGLANITAVLLASAKKDVSGLRNDRDMWRDAAYQAADVSEELERSRRTIRALVVAFRDALHLTRRVASDETWNLWLQLVQRQASERRESERNQTSHD